MVLGLTFCNLAFNREELKIQIATKGPTDEEAQESAAAVITRLKVDEMEVRD